MEAAPHPWPALGVLLLRDGLVTKEYLEKILDEQRDSREQRLTGRRLGELLVARGAVTQAQVAALVAEQYELPFVDLDVSDIDLEVATLLTEERARRFSAVPISSRPDGSYLLAIADPATVLFSDELRRVLGAPPQFAVVGSDAIEAAIAYVHSRPAEVATDDSDTQAGADESDESELHHDPSAIPPVSPPGDEPYLGSQRTVAHLWPPLGALLIREGLVTDAELETALAQQRLSASRRLGEILVDRGVVSRAVVARLLAEQYELPYIELSDYSIDPEAANLLPESVARQHLALPTGFLPDGSLQVVVADPTKVPYSDELQRALGVPLSFAVGAPDSIEVAIASVDRIARTSSAETHAEELTEIGVAENVGEVDRPDDSPELAAEDETVGSFTVDLAATDLAEPAVPREPVPVVDESPELGLDVTREAQLVAEIPVEDDLETTIERALALGASSIHFSPQADGLVVRARIDGVMRDLATVADAEPAVATDRIATRAGLRTHVLPTVRGDKATLFARDHTGAPTSLADLGMTRDTEDAVRAALHEPSGAIVVCGPMRSGTTTTLYAALDALDTPERVVATIEDPVAHLLPGFDQVEVDEHVGVTFAQGLVAILRSDPDVVVVGEIRDGDTAAIAFDAALAGHHILSAVRAPTAAGAVRRLVEMGLDPSLLASTLRCVVAQRLVRRVCADCRETYYATKADLVELDQPTEGGGPRLLARSRGCPACQTTGFRGRVGIFEVLPLTDDVRELVAAGASAKKIHRSAVAAGMRSLREDGVRLCLEGVTTVAEVRRALGDQSSY